MFDIGFSEILVFAAIALIVLGPDKLPQAARAAGKWYAKARRTVTTLQNEIEAELDLAETRKKMQEELAKIREAEAQMQQEMQALRGSMQKLEQENKPTLAHPDAGDNNTNLLTKDELEDSDVASHDEAKHTPFSEPIQHDKAGYPTPPQSSNQTTAQTSQDAESDMPQPESIENTNANGKQPTVEPTPQLPPEPLSVNLQKTTSQGSNNL